MMAAMAVGSGVYVLTYDQQTPACPLASVRICQLVMAAGGSSQLLRVQSSALPRLPRTECMISQQFMRARITSRLIGEIGR